MAVTWQDLWVGKVGSLSKSSKWLSVCSALQVHASACVDKTEQLALQLSSFAGYKGQSEGLLRPHLSCYALEASDQLCMRVNTISNYMEANRLVRLLCAYNTCA